MSFKCEYCKKVFKKESTIAVHMCEQKRRYMNKDEKETQLAYRIYQLFYKVGTNSKKAKTFDDFAKSQYYNAFIKFAGYCIEINIDSVEEYARYLIRNQIKIDRWASDSTLNKYIKQRLKDETADRAVERTIMFMETWAEKNSTKYNNYFKEVNPNLAVFHICSGKISPWVIYGTQNSESLLDRMNNEQIELISAFIDPDYWNVRTKRKTADFEWVRDILKKAKV